MKYFLIILILLMPAQAGAGYTLEQGQPFEVQGNGEVKFLDQKLRCIDRCFFSVPRQQKAGNYKINLTPNPSPFSKNGSNVEGKNKEVIIKVIKKKWEVSRFDLPPSVSKKLGGDDIKKTWDVIYNSIASSKYQAQNLDNFFVPTTGGISMDFGEQVYINGKFNGSHFGIDYKAPRNSEVYATFEGRVVWAGETPSYGNVVIIDHGYGIFSTYLHLEKILVEKNKEVEKGEKIALVGSTGVSAGPHLHFSLFVHGILSNPHEWYRFKNITVIKL
jgi:murein DD-endopeptidase MepM/ murein hydrolase activator NlpD